MSYDRNTETKQTLKEDIKALQGHCIEACYAIVNAPPETPITNENVTQKALIYVEGVGTDIINSNTPINTDDNLLTSQFLNEIKEKTTQLDELAAFTKAYMYELDKDINRVKSQIQIAEQAKSCLRVEKQQVQPQHTQKARERFQLLKSELHGLISSLFPDKAEAMKEILGKLMAAELTDSSNKYTTITRDNFCLMELLKERNIVTVNPYNPMEVKLAYN